MAALGWVERRGVAHLVRSVCQTGAVAASSFASLVVDAGGSRARARALRCRRFAT